MENTPATEIFNLRLQFVFNPLWIRRVADTFDEFTAFGSQLLVSFLHGILLVLAAIPDRQQH